MRAIRSVLCVLVLGGGVWADPPLGSGRGGIVPVLEGEDRSGPRHAGGAALAAEQPDPVDAAIRQALSLAEGGRLNEAVEVLRESARRTNLQDAKTRYFLARVYDRRARARRGSDPRGAAQDRRSSAFHLRGVAQLNPENEDDRRWVDEARDQLRRRAMGTPVMNQYTSGGTYPGGYCGPTALRMVLRMEGLPDPGADAVALQGARPYTAGDGSTPGLLARRAAELGLTGASFDPAGTLGEIADSVELGRPALISGEGLFTGTFSDGTRQVHHYDGHWMTAVGVDRDRRGRVSAVYVADPATGRNLRVQRDEFMRFFAPDGGIWTVTYQR